MFGLFVMGALAVGFIGDANQRGAIDLNTFPPAIHAEKFERNEVTKCTYDYSQDGCQ